MNEDPHGDVRLDAARRMLSRMPEEVFVEYIGQFAKKVPWTFDSISDSVIQTEWGSKFMHQSLALIANLRWSYAELPFFLEHFHPLSIDTLECVNGLLTPVRPLPTDSRSRLAFHMEYLSINRRLIKPPILQEIPMDTVFLMGTIVCPRCFVSSGMDLYLAAG